jgi:hypothetical protein
MAGESLKRPPAGYDPAHPFIDDIKRKDFALSTPLTDQEITGDDFLIWCFRDSAPPLLSCSSYRVP